MSRVSNGHTKPTKSKSLKLLAIGAVKIAVLSVKSYTVSLKNIYRSLMIIKLAKRGDAHARKIVAVMSDERICILLENP